MQAAAQQEVQATYEFSMFVQEEKREKVCVMILISTFVQCTMQKEKHVLMRLKEFCLEFNTRAQLNNAVTHLIT